MKRTNFNIAEIMTDICPHINLPLQQVPKMIHIKVTLDDGGGEGDQNRFKYFGVRF